MILPQNLKSDTLDICYVSVVLKVDSEPVISFLNRANPFSGVCLFVFFKKGPKNDCLIKKATINTNPLKV